VGRLTSPHMSCQSTQRRPLRQDRCWRGSPQEEACGPASSDHPGSLQGDPSQYCSRGSPCSWACRRPWRGWGLVERGRRDREIDVETSGAIGYFTRFPTRRRRRLLVCVILKLPFVKVPRSAWCFNFFLPHRTSAAQSANRRSCVISCCSLVVEARVQAAASLDIP
jgi:hypothetical protein